MTITTSAFGTSASIRYEPRGVCLIVVPWNYPFNVAFGPLVSAIAAGLYPVWRVSRQAPACLLKTQ